MKIAVLGATGMAGSAVVTEALRRQHSVLALSRRPDPTPRRNLSVRALDAARHVQLVEALTDVDALVLTIRLAPGQEHRLAPLTRGVLDAAARSRTRVLVIGGAGPLRSPSQPHRLLVSDATYVPPAYRVLASAGVHQLRSCQQHGHQDWVYLSPPAVLEPGERTGRYRRGTDMLLVDGAGDSRISTGDLAVAVLDELETPGAEQHFTVARLAAPAVIGRGSRPVRTSRGRSSPSTSPSARRAAPRSHH